MKNRAARIAIAIIFLAGFVFYTYRQEGIHYHSADVEYYGEAGGLKPEGYSSDGTIDDTAAPEDAEPTPEATPEPTADPNSPEAKAAALGLPAPPDIDVNSWEFMLVNGDNSIDQYEPEQLAYLNQTASETDIQTSYNANRCPVDERIAQPLLDMALGCKEAGLPVFLSSGYRSYSEQAQNFTRVCNNNGVSDGKDSNGHYITMPAGCSEHQSGLACDITDVYREIKNSEIENTDTYKWLLEHCAEYGFIKRYPTRKLLLTGWDEPWHYRYVGKEVATFIMENGLCYEEFYGHYFPDFEY